MDWDAVRSTAIVLSSIVALISVIFAIYTARSNKKLLLAQERNRQAGAYYVTWPSTNFALFENDDIADLEMTMHPYGQLSIEQIRRVHYFFEALNRTYAIFHNIQNGEPENDYSVSLINNICNVTYPSRDFIKTHVLPRGYTKSFADFIEEKWRAIDGNGGWPKGVLPMN